MENATDLFIDAADGLRVINEVEQLAAFEWAACQTSQGVRHLLAGLRPGMTEREAVRLLGWNGTPLSCHLMLTAGPRARFGLLSPGDRPIERGDPLTTAFGIWGALNCRAGFVVEEASELPDEAADYVERLVAPYFEAVAEWYEALHVGQVGGELQAIVDRHLGDPFFGIFLNPGHQLHLDEWVSSPVFPGSTIELRSGMALQCDIIPATGTPYFTTNIEDGLALADESLRAAFAAALPGRVDPDPGSPGVHGAGARHRAAPRRVALLQPRRPPATVLVAARPGDDDRRLRCARGDDVTARTLTLGGRTYPVLLPNTRDPRLHVAAVIITIHVLGQVGLGFQVSVPQILAAILTCAVLEVALTFRARRAFVWPASAMLTGSGVALILRVPGHPATMRGASTPGTCSPASAPSRC